MSIVIPDTLDALLVPIDAVRPDPANYNQHSAAQIEQIAASLVAFGFDQPILARRNGLIIAGHGRLLAARQVGMTHVPVVYTDLDGVDAARRMIGDNRLAALAEPDTEALAELLRQLQAEDALGGTGYDDAAVDQLLGDMEPVDWPELQHAAVHQVTVRYELEDEAALKWFIDQMDDKPLSPVFAGKGILERIKEQFETSAHRV